MRLTLLLATMLTVASPAVAYVPQVREARAWLRERMSDRQFRCLHVLWDKESSWRVRARGPLTPWGRARGIPQALPGRKMRSAEHPGWGPKWDDWRTDALVQVAWGLKHYIRPRYGTACRALAFQEVNQWY